MNNIQHNELPSMCPFCEGELEDRLITHEESDEHGAFYLFQNVPARVCVQCGEVWLPASTLTLLDRVIKEAKPKKTIETPVYDLAEQPL